MVAIETLVFTVCAYLPFDNLVAACTPMERLRLERAHCDTSSDRQQLHVTVTCFGDLQADVLFLAQ